MCLLRVGGMRPLWRVVFTDLLEHHALALASYQRALRTFVRHVHPHEVGIEAGERQRVWCVDGHREKLHSGADSVLLAQIERVACRVSQRDPRWAVGETLGTERDRSLRCGLVLVDEEVEVELLRALLPGPVRRDMVRR